METPTIKEKVWLLKQLRKMESNHIKYFNLMLENEAIEKEIINRGLADFDLPLSGHTRQLMMKFKIE